MPGAEDTSIIPQYRVNVNGCGNTQRTRTVWLQCADERTIEEISGKQRENPCVRT